MKRLYVLTVAVPALALFAAAQDPAETKVRANLDKMRAEMEKVVAQSKVIGLAGGAMGATVKGAPYSAVEVNESNQVLADGTRIHNESKTTVYRDSEGRVRRETPNQTTIMDPVAGVSYFLNPETHTATKTNLAMPLVYKRALAFGPDSPGIVTESSTFEVVTKDGATSVTVNGKPVDPATVKWERRAMTSDDAPLAGALLDEAKARAAKAKADVEANVAIATIKEGGMLRNRITSNAHTEALGKQMIEGVNADGTRVSTTLETGTIGNDRPIQVVNERWYSSELQTVMMTKHSDPRTGEEIFRLTNVSRSEPGADLFQVPTSYQLNERK